MNCDLACIPASDAILLLFETSGKSSQHVSTLKLIKYDTIVRLGAFEGDR